MGETGSLLVAVALSVASSVVYAAAAVRQERLAAGSMSNLARDARWWAAIALNGVGAVLHLVALRYGPLSLVQPLGVLTLVLAVPFAASAGRRGVTAAERRGMALTVAGLLGLFLVIGSGGGVDTLTGYQLVVLLSATAAALAALGGRSRVPGASGLWAATAGGIAFGVSSAVSQTIAVHVSADGLAAVARPVVVVATVAVAALSTAGLLFTQRSYRAGLAAPLAVGTLANPVAAAAIGLVLLGERIAAGTVGVLRALVAAAVAAVGVALLSAARGAQADAGRAPAGTTGARADAGRAPTDTPGAPIGARRAAAGPPDGDAYARPRARVP